MRFLELYKRRRVSIEIRVEGKDIETNIFVPFCSIYYDDNELNIATNQSPGIVLTDLVKMEDPELESYPEQTKQAKAFIEKVVQMREKWVRDCVFASGLIEPTYSLLGFEGRSANSQKSFASLISPESYLHFFDTNIFMKHFVSNYLGPRRQDMDKMVAATAPAVVWELEALSSRDTRDQDMQQSRIAKSAFRDLSFIQGSAKYIGILPESEDEKSDPSDRMIRSQIRRFVWYGTNDEPAKATAKLFVTFDRISSLAAHAEGLLCASLDVPIEKSSWDVMSITHSPEDMTGSLLREFAIMCGKMKLGCEGVTDLYIMGDWPGKSSHEWIKGLICWGNFPV
jgi:hypothetical protein